MAAHSEGALELPSDARSIIETKREKILCVIASGQSLYSESSFYLLGTKDGCYTNCTQCSMNNIVDAATYKEFAVGDRITVRDVEGVVRLPVEVKLKPYCDTEECSGCGSPSILTDATGSIFSTNFLTGDEQYYPKSNCVWTIIAPVGRYIHLNFHSFDVSGRTYGDQIRCISYLALYNGSEVNDDQRLGQFCGSQIPLLSSTSNELTVVFSTDREGDGRGFNATYYTTGCMLSECGHDTHLHSECGYINSLGYPNPYPPESKCSWNIQVADGDVIHLEFLDFNVGDSDTTCSSDFVRLSEANRSTTVCGYDNPRYFISATSQVRIEFQRGTNWSRGYTGFMAKYSAAPYQLQIPEDSQEINVYVVLKPEFKTFNGVLRVNGKYYPVYISTDELRCFSCHCIGHVRKNCPKNFTVETTESELQPQLETANENTNHVDSDYNTDNTSSPESLTQTPSSQNDIATSRADLGPGDSAAQKIDLPSDIVWFPDPFPW
ncbi:exoskeleton protein RP43-like [Ptychodera flava]|uniref:exoskeleton protein RP43-like n=1 Tax=Ptychodera flava TaxID=63121 RepID=UPI003969E9BC